MIFQCLRSLGGKRALDVLAEQLDAFLAVLDGTGQRVASWGGSGGRPGILADLLGKMHSAIGGFAVRSHFAGASKNSPSFSRKARLARWSRLFTAGTVRSRAWAMSSFESPSTSLSRNTVR